MRIHLPICVLMFCLTINDCESRKVERSQSELSQMYEQFLKQYRGEQNLSETEGKERLEIFRQNVHRIDKMNAKSNLTTYGINKFADWTRDEHRKFLPPILGERENEKEEGGRFRRSTNYGYYRWDGTGIPAFFDLREAPYYGMTPVKTQTKGCSSCWAFATLAVVETLYKMKHGITVQLSESEMVDCDATNDGCWGGSTRRAMRRGLSQGFTKLSHYPWSGYSACPSTGNLWIKSVQVISADENSIASYLVKHGPIALNVAFPEFYKSYRNGILPDTYECSADYMIPNHSVMVVGFGVEDGIKYWILKNSWGDWWGEQGYFRMMRGINACQIESFATSATID